ncbi:putative replication protein [Shigella sonnei]|nr:putative replication protein [Shigella sonnei]
MKNIATGDVLERIRRLAPSHVTAPFKTVAEWREWAAIRVESGEIHR